MAAVTNRRRSLIALAAVTGALVLGGSSGTAAAAKAADPPFHVQAQNGTLTVTGTSAKDIATIDVGLLPGFNGITVRAGKLFFASATVTTGPGCFTSPDVGPWVAFCIAPVSKIVMNGNDGWDRLWNHAASIPAVINGGEGDDFLKSLGSAQIIGGNGNDNIVAGSGGTALMSWPWKNDLQGGPGKDTIEGSSAPDAVNGGIGVDTITTLAGNDIVDARDGGKDTVNCGNDNDVALIDNGPDSRKNCEQVLF